MLMSFIFVGRDWLLGFMDRHKNELSLRKPENTSLARSMAFNKPVVDNFFSKYSSILKKYKFSPNQIWNLDETGLTTVMEPPKVVASKGKKQVANVSAQERGESITVTGMISAVGGTVPPVFLYPRLRNPMEYLGDDYPAGSLALGNKTGYMTSAIFPQIIDHFAGHVKCSKEDKVLLIMDNHESHISVKAIESCRNKGIVLFTVPPHTINKLQPLDVGINGPFKTYMAKAEHDWLLSNPGEMITIRHLARLAKIAYEKAYTIKNITSSFQATGLWPVNSLVFADDEFAPAEVTDKPLVVNDSVETGSAELPAPDKTPSTSSTSEATLLSEIRPFPKADFKEKKAKRSRKGKSAVYTDTPEYEERKGLEQMQQKRKMSVTKAEKSVKRNLSKVEKKRRTSTSSESSIDVFLNDSSEEDEFMEEMKFLNKEDTVAVGNFVLVKFVVRSNSQKTDVYYAGEVLSAYDEGYEVKFMRRKSRSHHFTFPDVDDISLVEKKDIVGIAILYQTGNYQNFERLHIQCKFFLFKCKIRH
nr:unnamed protein product [Callosobruchus analis]